MRRYGAGSHRAPWCNRIHQVPAGKHAFRSPEVHAESELVLKRNQRESEMGLTNLKERLEG